MRTKKTDASLRYKYRQIAEELCAELRRKRPGDLLSSEIELARRFDVSPMTIRAALRILEEDGCLERGRGRPTRIVRTRETKPVAVMLEHDISEPRVSYGLLRVFQTVRRNLIRAGIPHRPYLGFAQAKDGYQELSSCPDFTEDLDAGRLAGAAMVGMRWLPEWGRIGPVGDLPVVGLTNNFRHYVNRHDPDRLRHGIDHLVRQGCRRLGMMYWRRPGAPVQPGHEETPTALFGRELERHGLETQPEWMQGQWHPMLPGAGWEEFRSLWLGGERPDGLLVTDDVLFQDAALALLELGVKVPHDLKLAVFTNRGSGLRYPFPVAEIEQDPDEVADAMCSLLMAQLHGRQDIPARIDIRYRLVHQLGSSDFAPAGLERGGLHQLPANHVN